MCQGLIIIIIIHTVSMQSPQIDLELVLLRVLVSFSLVFLLATILTFALQRSVKPILRGKNSIAALTGH